MLDFNRLSAFIHVLGFQTEKGPVRWRGNDTVGYSCAYKGFKIAVWWWQDGKPGISLNGASFESYGYGIEALIGVIRAQSKRAEEAKQSPALREQHRKQEEARTKAADENIRTLNNAVGVFFRKYRS